MTGALLHRRETCGFSSTFSMQKWYTSCTWNAINRQGQRMKFRDASGMHLLNMVNIIQGFQRFDNFGMGFIFFQHFAADGNGYGID